MPDSKNRYGSIECIRFIFSVIIVFYHIFCPGILEYVDNNAIFRSMAKHTVRAYIIVDFFFIIAGFFLTTSIKRGGGKGIGCFALNKAARLGPVLWFAMLICAVVLHTADWVTAFMNSCFLQCIGLSAYWRGITWYVSPYFWTVVTLYAALTLFDRKKTNFILAIIVYLAYTYSLNSQNGYLTGREVVNNFISLGILRAVAGIGFGYLLHLTMDWLTERLSVKWDDKGRLDCRLFVRIMLTLVELALAAIVFKCLCFSHLAFKHDFVYILFFSAFLVMMILRGGFFSRLLDNRLSEAVGKYSYSIYVMQGLCFTILSRTFWQNKEYISMHPTCSVAITLVFCIFVGIVVYYAVEKPSSKLLRKCPLFKP